MSGLVTGITSPHPLTLGVWGGGGERGKDKKEDGGWKEVWGEKKEEEWNLEWFIISRCYKNMLMVCLVILNKEKRKSEARPI